MRAFRTVATVDNSGELILRGLPFADGAQVEVVVREPPEDRKELLERLERLFRETQSLSTSKNITDEDIAFEIEEYRAGR